MVKPTAKDTTHLSCRTQRNQAELTRKFDLCWLAFIVLEGAIQAAGGEKLTTVPATEPDLACYNTDLSGTDIMLEWLL